MRGLPALSMLVAHAVAACGGDGIHIEIRPGEAPDVTRVELYLTDRTECTIPNTDLTCTTIVLPGDGQQARLAFDGDLYQVDDPTPFHADVVDGSAWFYLAPDSGEVQVAIAIGRGADGRVVATRILTQKMDTSAGLQHFRADLRAVTSTLDQGEVSAVVWPEREDVPYHCVAAVEGNHQVAIVPEKDPDCDFVDPALECRPTVHLANQPPSQNLPELTCAAFGAVPNADVCLLGDRACDETQPVPNKCETTQIPICVPDAVCACPRLDDTCVTNLVDPDPIGTPDTTRLVCGIPVADDGTGTLVACGTQPLPVSLGGGASCGPAVEIMPLFVPLSFGPSLDVTTAAGNLTIQAAATNGCEFVLVQPNAQFASDVFPITEHALVKITIDPGTPRARFAILPLDLELQLEGGCSGNEIACEFRKAPGERMAGCFNGG